MNSPNAVDPTDRLLERAHRLRRLAERLSRLAALALGDIAGEDTWRGPRPDLCRTMLEHNSRQIRRRSEELLATAREMERRVETARTLVGLGEL